MQMTLMVQKLSRSSSAAVSDFRLNRHTVWPIAAPAGVFMTEDSFERLGQG